MNGPFDSFTFSPNNPNNRHLGSPPKRATNAHHYVAHRPYSSPPRPPPIQIRSPSPHRQLPLSNLFTKPQCQQCQNDINKMLRATPDESITLDDMMVPDVCPHKKNEITASNFFTWNSETGVLTSKPETNLPAYITISPNGINEIVITTNGRDQIFNIVEIPENNVQIYKPYQHVSLYEDTEPLNPSHVYIQDNNLYLILDSDDELIEPVKLLTDVKTRFNTFVMNNKKERGRGRKKKRTNKRKPKRKMRFTKHR